MCIMITSWGDLVNINASSILIIIMIGVTKNIYMRLYIKKKLKSEHFLEAV